MITESQYVEMRARYDRKTAWIEQYRASLGVKPSQFVSYQSADVPENARISNEEISAIEVFEFCTNPPDTYVAYVKLVKPLDLGYGKITTWIGDKLGEITRIGARYPLFRRKHHIFARKIRVKAINDKLYAGTFYESSGDYCRLRMVKG